MGCKLGDTGQSWSLIYHPLRALDPPPTLVKAGSKTLFLQQATNNVGESPKFWREVMKRIVKKEK